MGTLEDFRTETRTWLEQNCPDGAKGAGQTPLGSKSIELEPDVRTWLDRMAKKGWTVPTWPVEYGGAALNNDEYKILIEELKRVGARDGSQFVHGEMALGRWVIQNRVPVQI